MINNIIYNNFVRLFIKYRHTAPMDLTAEKTYKIALFTSVYTPDEEEYNTFYDLQLNGYEVEDENESYEAGGSYIKFTSVDPTEVDGNKVIYSAGNVTWTDTEIQDACYAIIYRESDGLLISCHDFGHSITTDHDDIVIDWENVPTIVFSAESEDEEKQIDSDLNLISDFALENRVITLTFKNLGVIFTDDLGKDDPYPKEIPNILPIEYLKAETFVEGGEYYYLNNKGEYKRVQEPVEENLDDYYVKSVQKQEDILNSMSYVTMMPETMVDNIFDDVVGED